MRIGIDARMYSPKFTGIGRVNFELIQHLIKMNTEHTFVLFFNDPEYTMFKTPQKNVEKVLVNARHYSVKEQMIFLRKLYDAKLDLMHFTHFNNPILYFGKQVVTIHDTTPSFFPGKKNTSWIHKLGYNLSIWSVTKKAKKIIAVSENTKKDLIKLFHLPAEKIKVIYEGASSTFTTPPKEAIINEVRTTYHLKKPFLLFTGVWRNHKNVVGLIKAFHKLRTEYKIDCDLVITGKRDPVYHEVDDTVKALGLEEQVKRVGLVPEPHLGALYHMAKLYVFPSFYEGFGIPPLEAFAARLPVASSNTSCLPEIYGQNAVVYFDPYDINDMAKVVADLYQNEEKQKQLIQAGKDRLKLFSWEKMTEETLKVYEKCLSY